MYKRQLYYPERRFLAGERVDFGKIAQITFENPDPENFRGLALAYQAATVGGSMPTVFNAANEKAVAKFLNRKIGFLDITDIIEYCMSMHKAIPVSYTHLDVYKRQIRSRLRVSERKCYMTRNSPKVH